MLSVLLLGIPQVVLDGKPLAITRRKNRALLYYCAAQPVPLAREQLLTMFWPDLDRAAAQTALRSTLHSLRKELDTALNISDSSIALDSTIDIDARVFERQLMAPPGDPQMLAAALERYRGDFLDGFALADAPLFEDWLRIERERYRRLWLRGLVALAQLYQEQRNYVAAQEMIERALAANPLHEEIQRIAMRLDYAAGNRIGAIRRFEELRRMLDDELGVPPMAETQQLYDAIITDSMPSAPASAAPSPPPAAAPAAAPAPAAPARAALPFVGRDAELEALRDLARTHRLIMIEGEAGIGKTRLASEFLQDAGVLALVGAAHELEQALPYQPVIEALRSLLVHPEWAQVQARMLQPGPAAGLPMVWLAEMARLVPELVLADRQESAGAFSHPPTLPDIAESRLWEGVSQFLRMLSSHWPIALFLDDLQWADTSTLALLGYLVRQAPDMPIFFLATARPFGPRSPLAGLAQILARGDHLARLPLARLGSDDVAALARTISPAFTYPLSSWLMRNSEGNPYVIAEMVRFARASQILSSNGALNLAALSDTPLVPPNIYSLNLSRIARLSALARRLLDAAAVQGREFDFLIAAQAAGLSEDQALDALDELREIALIATLGGPRYTFDHTLTHEVAYRELGEQRRQLLHRRSADAMEQQHQGRIDEFAGLLASHFTQGGAPERAAAYAIRAGQRAASLAAWEQAATFYEQALAGLPQQDTQRRLDTLMALGQVRTEAGEGRQASEAFQRARQLASEHGDTEAANRAWLASARAAILQNRYAEVIAIAQQLHKVPSYGLEAEILWGTALSLEGARLEEATAHLNAAAEHCAAQSNPLHLAHIIFELGGLAAQQGNLPLAITRYRSALAIAERNPQATSYHILAHNNLGYHLMLQGDPSAIEHARTGMRLAQESGALGLQPFLYSTLGEIALAQGDLDGAERSFSDGLALADRLQIPERVAGLTANLGLLAQRRGQIDQAIELLRGGLAGAEAIGAHHLVAQIQIWLGQLLPPEQARAQLAAARTFAETSGRTRLQAEITEIERQRGLLA